MNQQPDENMYRVRSQTKALLSSWGLGSGSVASRSLMVPHVWRLSKKEKDQNAVFLGFYGDFMT